MCKSKISVDAREGRKIIFSSFLWLNNNLLKFFQFDENYKLMNLGTSKEENLQHAQIQLCATATVVHTESC